MESVPRPDLAAQSEAVRVTTSQIVGRLAELMGRKLTAYVGGSQDVRAVERWISGEVPPSETQEKLRFAYVIARMLSEREDVKVIQAWFIGLNPELGDRSPLKLIRESNLDAIGSEIVGAARSFYSAG